MSTGPVARVGDLTVHGGAIVQGDPTMLVDGLPVATVGSMHVCPMCNPGTPPPPHVGGPVANGVPWFTVNGKPVATLGCMCVCSGPPDTIAMGSPTMIVGAGGGGAGGGGGGGSNALTKAAMHSAASAQSLTPEETVLEAPFMAAQMIDGAQQPEAVMPYAATGPGDWDQSGFLPGNGQLLRSRLPEETESEMGTQAVYGARWSTEETRVGEEVTLTAYASGIEDGTSVVVMIYARLRDAAGVSLVHTLETEVSGEKVEVSQTFPLDDSQEEISGAYVARVQVGSYPRTVHSPELRVVKDVTVGLDTINGTPIANAEYIAHLANGETRSGTLDRSGRAELTCVPADAVDIRYPAYQVTQRLRNGERSAQPEGTQHPTSTHTLEAAEDEAVCTVDAIHLRCAHDISHGNHDLSRSVELSDATQPFAVVPDVDADGVDTVEIVYCGPTEADDGTLRANGFGLKPVGGETQTEVTLSPDTDIGEHIYSVDVVAPQPEGYAFWRRDFWSVFREPSRVTVHGIPDTTIDVDVYSGDQYELEIAFPPLGTLNVGQKLENGAGVSYQTEENQEKLGVEYNKTHTFEAEMSSWDPLSGQITSAALVERDGMMVTTKFDSDGSIASSTTRERGRAAAAGQQQAGVLDVVDLVKLKKNGRALVANPGGTATSMLKLASAIYEVITAIRELPKFGWYCDFNVQIMQGALAAKWGWTENDDHRAFLQYALQMKLMLLQLKIEIGIGVSAFNFAVQVFASIVGKLELSAEGMKASADGDLTAEIRFAPTIEGLVGARAELGRLLTVEATMVTGIELGAGTLHLTTNGDSHIEASISWTGVKAVVSGSAQTQTRDGSNQAPSDQIGGESVLIPKKKLADWRWPEAETYEASYIDREELEQILAATFQSDLYTVEEQTGYFDLKLDREVPPEDLAREAAPVVMRRGDVKRDAKTMEGFAIALKKRLNDRAGGIPFLREIDYADFRAFVHGDEMQGLLDEHVDTFETVKQKMEVSSSPSESSAN